MSIEDFSEMLIGLRDEVRNGFRETSERFRGVEQHLDRLTDRVETLTDRVGAVEVRVENLGHHVDGRFDTLTDRVETLTDRVGAVEVRVENLGHRVVDSEIRLATAVMDLKGTLLDTQAKVKKHSSLPERVERCERDIDELKKRLT